MGRYLTAVRFAVVGLLLITPCSFAQQVKVMSDDGRSGDFFGYSVAIDKGVALVGAFKADVKDSEDAGAAYVYVKTKDGWQQQAKLTATPRYTFTKSKMENGVLNIGH